MDVKHCLLVLVDDGRSSTALVNVDLGLLVHVDHFD